MIDIGVQSVFLHLMHTLNCPERSSENKDMCVNLNNGVTGVTGKFFEYHITPQRLSQWLQIVTWYVNVLDTCLKDIYPAPAHLEWAKTEVGGPRYVNLTKWRYNGGTGNERVNSD